MDWTHVAVGIVNDTLRVDLRWNPGDDTVELIVRDAITLREHGAYRAKLAQPFHLDPEDDELDRLVVQALSRYVAVTTYRAADPVSVAAKAARGGLTWTTEQLAKPALKRLFLSGLDLRVGDIVREGTMRVILDQEPRETSEFWGTVFLWNGRVLNPEEAFEEGYPRSVLHESEEAGQVVFRRSFTGDKYTYWSVDRPVSE